ncbi:retinol-binding protein pinta isoform X1 [Monomorium pharaonis]|uniref:retinol-binding protein pinta isoform X1 n=1 Tax=Monomorium pharaonis TaxID=307658 RepID=UPI00174788DC|nr:retinol-binding protein pinta isoform X1 [Monomorium pharaonis]
MTTACNYSDSTVHPAWLELTSEDKRYAEVHLNETDGVRENAITEIKRWIEECDELCIQIDDFLILRFLRVCKFDLEKTKTRIHKFYKMRSVLPEYCLNRDPFQPKLQELLNMGLFLPLREPDNQGKLVCIIRITRYDPKIYKFSNVLKIIFMFLDLAMKNYISASIYGCSLFVDMTELTLSHIIQWQNPYTLMKLANFMQDCSHVRVQSINVINAPIFINIVINIFKSFLSNKMKSRIHVNSHMLLSCFTDVSTRILPIEYGGTGDTVQELTEYWKNLAEENRDWFINEENDKFIPK